MQFHRKKPVTFGCNSAGSKIENGIFYEEKLIKQSYCWVNWLQHHEPKQLKTKAKKGKNLLWKDHMKKPMIENIKKTDCVSTKNKYFAFLDEESSCSAENSSKSQEKPHVKRGGDHVLECAKV